MNSRKGLTNEEITRLLDFNWDDSDTEADPEPSATIVSEEHYLNQIVVYEDITATEILNDNLLEAEVPDDDLEEIDISAFDIPLPEAEQQFKKIDLKKLKWRKKDFQPPGDHQWKGRIDPDVEVQTALQYFQMFFDSNMISQIVEETNRYAVLKSGASINVANKEIEQYLGILLYMGIVKYPEMRMVWQADFRIPLIDAAMTGKRFEKIKQYLHFSSDEKPKEHPEYDKLHKIRPILEGFRKNCAKIPAEQYHCIDEQIIPFKGRQHLKQYNPRKPHKWGFKMFTRCGKSGIIYDFALYVGDGTCPSYGLGISSDIVVHLVKDLPEHQNFEVFFDNWFTSFQLMTVLKAKGFVATGTVRSNRLGKCDLHSDSKLKEKGRGSYDYRVEAKHDVVVVKWYDNKSVQLLSTNYGIEPIASCRRWSSKDKTFLEIPQPNIVQQYNRFMGGVDLSDMLCELYRIDHRSLKYYMRIFYWVLNSAVINSWLLYKRHCDLTGISGRETLNLIQFQIRIATGLIHSNTFGPRKRGRPSASPQSSPSTSRRNSPSIQSEDVQYDGFAHFPSYKTTQSRCKLCKNGFTTVICTKCNVSLCFTPKRNCFTDFHVKN